MKSPSLLQTFCFVVGIPILLTQVYAQTVPGTGIQLSKVGDDFEDANWKWIPNGPKSSREQDSMVRRPSGYSANRRWFESPKRGMPDVIERVATPANGLPGSKGALRLQTLNTGIPGRPSNQMEQDDFIMACASRVGTLSVSRSPSCTVRVWLPPFEHWENRSGSHFGYRADLKTTISEKEKRLFFTKSIKKPEAYWPGFFIEFHSSHDPRFQQDEAVLLIRGNNSGHEVRSVQITPGWWTLGMSFTPDGQVHFYGRKGVEDLRAQDHLYSSFPYGYQAERFATHFFNSVNHNDGRTWSTPIIIDDPAVFVQQPRRLNINRNSVSMEIDSPNELPTEDIDSRPRPDSRQQSLSSTGTLHPHLTVRKKMPESATLGQAIEYAVVVTNDGTSTARNVIVEDEIPAAARIDITDPPAEYDPRTHSLIWQFDELRSGEFCELMVRLTPTDQGVLSSSATVHFNTNAQVTTSTFVHAPILTLELKTPRPVRVGEETQLRYMVRNDGDGTATDVVLRSDLPSGLRHPVGSDLEYAIDTLEPDAECEIVLNVIAAEPGDFTTRAELIADGIPGDTADATVRIVGQQIQVVRQAPQPRYIDRSPVYSNIVNTAPQFDTAGLHVIERIPEGMRLERTSYNGIYYPHD